MAFLSSHGTKNYCEIDFVDDLFLIFGKESIGLSNFITAAHSEVQFKIPLLSPHIRSLNLANAVSVVIYEGLRQTSFGT